MQKRNYKILHAEEVLLILCLFLFIVYIWNIVYNSYRRVYILPNLTINNMKCVICGEEEADGKYEEFGICPICGGIVEDIIAVCFKKFSKLDPRHRFPDFFKKQMAHIEEIAGWMWTWIMEEDEEAAKGADDRFYKRLELVVSWMRNNNETVEKMCKEFFCKCVECGEEITPETVKIEETHGWFKVFCKNCGDLIAKCFSPREI